MATFSNLKKNKSTLNYETAGNADQRNNFSSFKKETMKHFS